ncbi:hypothetical protein ACFVH6_21905 [Spirillospora sp. NPDC127200]
MDSLLETVDALRGVPFEWGATGPDKDGLDDPALSPTVLTMIAWAWTAQADG